MEDQLTLIGEHWPVLGAAAAFVWTMVKSVGANIARLAKAFEDHLEGEQAHREAEREHWAQEERLLRAIHDDVTPLLAHEVLQ